MDDKNLDHLDFDISLEKLLLNKNVLSCIQN